jgi:dTDP-4-amino-4,6-dideoxygalactose transaminase
MNMRKNIPLFKVYMAKEVDSALLDTLHSGYIGEGPKVKEFEKNLSKCLRNECVLTCNSGTAALHLAYHMVLHKDSPKEYDSDSRDEEIITTPMTCTATNTPIIANGAKIVWADCDPITGNISPESIASRITERTRAVTMMHWGGYPCDIEKINELARQNGLLTIEDAAHAMGMDYMGKPVGSHSDCIVKDYFFAWHKNAWHKKMQ